jgi:hypothetical protein
MKGVTTKRLTKPERLLNEQMLPILEWAAEHPKRWHDIGKMPESQKAAELLEKRGVIEIRQPMNQYRLKPAPKVGRSGSPPPEKL